eukprot:SAG11_NODE_9140_length_939_cov_1.082143_1_plen_135_part_00
MPITLALRVFIRCLSRSRLPQDWFPTNAVRAAKHLEFRYVDTGRPRRILKLCYGLLRSVILTWHAGLVSAPSIASADASRQGTKKGAPPSPIAPAVAIYHVPLHEPNGRRTSDHSALASPTTTAARTSSGRARQ